MSDKNGQGEDLPFEADEEFEFDTSFEEIQGGTGSALLPEGMFLFEIARWEKQPGNEFGKSPQVICELRVVEVLDKGHSIYIDQGFIEWFSLSPNAQWRVKAFMDAVFGRAISGKHLPKAESIIGKRIVAEVYQDEYDGKKRTKVRGGRFLPTRQWANGIGSTRKATTTSSSTKNATPPKSTGKTTAKSGSEDVDL